MAPAFLQSRKQAKHDKLKNTDLLVESNISSIETIMHQQKAMNKDWQSKFNAINQ